jgi:hypothetical protein
MHPLRYGVLRSYSNAKTVEPLAKLPSGYRLCQGTTSVVPQMANLDSGFSRCGIANY